MFCSLNRNICSEENNPFRDYKDYSSDGRANIPAKAEVRQSIKSSPIKRGLFREPRKIELHLQATKFQRNFFLKKNKR